jgi:FADH2 O2-dependent halogenase
MEFPKDRPMSESLNEFWYDTLRKYPSLAEMMVGAAIVEPSDPLGMPALQYVQRMSRCRSQAAGAGWVMLPVAFGFIDPLHSFGIAHSLSGIARVANALLGRQEQAQSSLNAYAQELRRETEWFDTIISGSYRGLPSFERFVTFASFYFMASIAFEQQMASDPEHWPLGFMNAADIALRQAAEAMWLLASDGACGSQHAVFVESVRRAIDPWNTVGILAPENRNRFAHTAPPKRSLLGRK